MMAVFNRRWGIPAMVFFTLLVPMNTQGASFNVNPIGFQLPAQKTSDVLRVVNTGTEEVRVQVDIFEWGIEEQKEQLNPTQDFIINPSIFTVAPGKTQIIRFGLRQPLVDLSTEKSYRLFVEQVPEEKMTQTGLQTLLKVSIPVFITPSERREVLSWTLKRTNKGGMLSASNEGNVHRKVLNFSLKSFRKDDEIKNTFAYVLPGQTKEWVLTRDDIPSNASELYVQTPNGSIKESLHEE